MDEMVKVLIDADERTSMSVYLREIALLMEENERLKAKIKELENGQRN